MDWTKSKFESRDAELLYGTDPDESIGSVNELGWAGRYDEELSILIEDSQGFVWVDLCDSPRELAEAWQAVLDTYEEYDYGLIV